MPLPAFHKPSHIDLQKRSGLSISAYCRKAGICEQTFYNHRKRFLSTAPANQLFAELPSVSIRPSGYRLHLADCGIIDIPRGFDRQEVSGLIAIVRTIGRSAPC